MKFDIDRARAGRAILNLIRATTGAGKGSRFHSQSP
jgi:hypothetical protein